MGTSVPEAPTEWLTTLSICCDNQQHSDATATLPISCPTSSKKGSCIPNEKVVHCALATPRDWYCYDCEEDLSSRSPRKRKKTNEPVGSFLLAQREHILAKHKYRNSQIRAILTPAAHSGWGTPCKTNILLHLCVSYMQILLLPHPYEIEHARSIILTLYFAKEMDSEHSNCSF